MIESELSLHDEARLHSHTKKLMEEEDELAKESLYFIELLQAQNRNLKSKNEELEERDAKRLNNKFMW